MKMLNQAIHYYLAVSTCCVSLSQAWNAASKPHNSQTLLQPITRTRTTKPTAAMATNRRPWLPCQNQYRCERRMTTSTTTTTMMMSKHEEQHDEDENISNSNHHHQQQNHHPNGTSSSAADNSNYEQAAQKKFRLAKAQADIDRILNNPVDTPFDIDSELKKVVSISPPPNEGGTTEEYAFEEQISQMEEELYQAVKQQDYAKAAKQQQAISQLHVDDCGLVLQVNSHFYSAFSKKNWDDMKQVWLPDLSCVCIHPSQKPLLGIKDILASWKRMFQHASGGFQKTWMEPHQIRLTVKGTMAIVTCEEHVFARRFVRGQKRQTELVNKLQATNVFRKVGNQWYMTYHHSSWHADSEAAKLALKGGSGSTANSRNSGGGGNPTNGRKRILVRRGDGSSKNVNPEDIEGLESILGINDFGPILGDETNTNDDDLSSSSDKPIRRVFMGPLSDILNGDLGALLGPNGGKGNDGDGSNNNNNKNNNNNMIEGFTGMPMSQDMKNFLDSGSANNGENGAIIQFRRIDDDYDDDEEEEDDEEDDDDGFDVVDDDDDDEQEEIDAEESVAMLKQWADKNSDNGATTSSSSSPSSQSSSPSSSSFKKKHDTLRQNCISALRKLTNEGRISPKQKRVLLTDIISCSAKGEYSMVEVAYELLCAESNDGTAASGGISDAEADAEEEFADQCRVFAQSFTD